MAKFTKDHGYAWVILIYSTLCNTLLVAILMAPTVFLVNFIEAFDISTYYAGWIVSIHSCISAVGGLFGGMLIEKFSCRSVGFIGALVSSIGMMVASQVYNLALFVISLSIVSAFALSLCRLPSIVIIQMYFEKKRPFATGMSLTGYSIGTFIGMPLIAHFIEEYGWRGALMLTAGLCLNMCIFTLTYTTPRDNSSGKINTLVSNSEKSLGNFKVNIVRKSDSYSGKSHENIKITVNGNDCIGKSNSSVSPSKAVEHYQQIPQDNAKTEKKNLLSGSLFKNSNFLIIGISFSLFVFGADTLFKMSAPRVELDLGADKLTAAMMISAISIGEFFSRIFSSIVANLNFVNIKMMYCISILAGGCVVIVLAFIKSYTMNVVVAATYGLMYGMTMSVQTTVLVDLLGVDKISKSQGILTGMFGIVLLITVPYAGLMYDHFKSFVIAYVTVGILQCIGGCVSLFILCGSKTSGQYADNLQIAEIDSLTLPSSPVGSIQNSQYMTHLESNGLHGSVLSINATKFKQLSPVVIGSVQSLSSVK